MEEQKLAGQVRSTIVPIKLLPKYHFSKDCVGPSAIAARGGKYRTLPGVPGHSVVSVALQVRNMTDFNTRQTFSRYPLKTQV